jgi:autotransporter-associated beta strand protein
LGTNTLTITGNTTYTGPTTVAAGGTLQIGAGDTGTGFPTSSITNNGGLAFNRADNITLKSLSGPGSLTQIGPGNLTLVNVGATDPNYPGGGTAYPQGALVIGGGTLTSFGPAIYGPSSIVDNGELVVTAQFGGWGNLGTAISGSGGLYVAYPPNPGSYYNHFGLTGNDTFTGPTVIQDGMYLTLANTSGGASGYALNSSTLMIGTGGSNGQRSGVGFNYNNQINPNTVVTFNGGPNLTDFDMNGTNQSVGGLINSDGAGLIEGNATTASPNPTLTICPSAGASYSYNGNLNDYTSSGTGGLSVTINGPGVQVLQGGSIRYSGTTTISQGTLELSNVPNFAETAGTGATVPMIDNGTLQLDGNTGLPCYPTQTFTITGSGALVKTGTGSYTALGGTNTYSGATTVNNGTLGLWSVAALPSGGSVAVNAGGELDLAQQPTVIIGALSGAGTIDSGQNVAHSLIVGAGDASSTFAGTIKNSNNTTSLTKTGAGTLLLSGNNTYSGVTTVNAGGLAVNGSLASNGTVIVNGGLAGTLSGAGSVGNVQIWGGGAALTPGYAGVGPTLTASSVTLYSGSVLNYSLGSVGAAGNSLLNITGGLSISSSITLNVTPASGWGSGGTYELASYAGTLTDNSTSFSGWTVAGVGLSSSQYSFSDTGGSLDVTINIAPTSVSGTWTKTTSGTASWTTAGNWAGSQVPTTTGDTALFGTYLSGGTATVTLDGSHTLSGLTFNNTAASYAITTGTGGNLTLVATSGAVTLANSGGSHSIGASVALGSNLNVTTAAGSKLAISGPVTQDTAGTSLNLGGSGTLVLSGSDSYSGGTTVTGGTLDVTSSQALPTTGTLVIGRNGHVVLGNITGAAELLAASPLASESISLASTPAVSSIDSSAAVQTSSLATAAVQVSVPVGAPLSGGPAAVPEPGTVLLLLVGAAALAVWRRRRA